MSGHSKWSKVKHQKAGTDAAKSAAFTKASRAITVAVREGGGVADPDKNFKLRLAIENARSVNMPKDTIDRAIERARGEGGRTIEPVLYEGYGPGGVALLIEATTDNRQRTVSEVKNLLERAGGTLATPGAVSYLFDQCGIVTIPKGQSVTFDRVMEAAVDSGASDVIEVSDMYEVYTQPQDLARVAEKLVQAGWEIDNTALIMRAKLALALSEPATSRATSLMEDLEALDDVQRVYSNVA